MRFTESVSRWGSLNEAGEEIVPAIFEYLRSFSEGMAPVLLGTDSPWLDREGHFVIPCKFRQADSFSGGLSVVIEDDKFGVVNRLGESVVPIEFDNASNLGKGIVAVRKLGKATRYFNEQGQEIIPR